MKVIPAIDLMGGKVVRLSQGDPTTAKTYSYLGEPVTVAKKWEREGADALHVVDLDAAFDKGNNLAIIFKIAKAVNLPIQVGGGIRKLETAEKLLNTGIDYIILGTSAFNNPDVLTAIQNKFGSERVIVALDHKNGKVMIEGWKTSVKLGIEEAMEKFLHLKIKTFLITSITKDGTLKGLDFDTLSKACTHPGVRIIAAGGVGSLKDITALKRIGVDGVVIGKALYEGLFTLKEALKAAKGD
ncbi:MAG: 1-(5-phosphoribosyl)-5-[(5-phosphoribosylamino)methylideneamino]imidazole-4-carboxamide isomerase [Candidatus Bathyarchaeia archaeon]